MAEAVLPNGQLLSEIVALNSASLTQAETILGRQEMVIVDISVPFGSMVVFMVKWAIASIPALIIIIILGIILAGMVGGLGVAIFG